MNEHASGISYRVTMVVSDQFLFNRDIGKRSWLRDPMKLISPLDGVCFLVLIKKSSY